MLANVLISMLIYVGNAPNNMFFKWFTSWLHLGFATRVQRMLGRIVYPVHMNQTTHVHDPDLETCRPDALPSGANIRTHHQCAGRHTEGVGSDRQTRRHLWDVSPMHHRTPDGRLHGLFICWWVMGWIMSGHLLRTVI